MEAKKGVLLVNLGTPEKPSIAAVRRYLRAFLSDPLVIDLPSFPRWVLLNFLILPFRPRQTVKAYQQIWTEGGSPLLVHSVKLAEELSKVMGPNCQVELAMRYGKPTLQDAIRRLKEGNCQDWVVVPLYPQYAKSTSESTWQEVSRLVSKEFFGLSEPALHELKPFYDNSHYIAALKKVTADSLSDGSIDHLLMSYHGLPERHLAPPVCCNKQCDKQTSSCPEITSENTNCYRAQCYAGSKALAQALGLGESNYTVSFQSRLGRIPWIGPDTEAIIKQLYEQGVRHLGVVMPAFVADCLETLEEVGIRLREQWLAMGETTFVLIPCLNANPAWVKALHDMIHDVLPVRLLSSGELHEVS